VDPNDVLDYLKDQLQEVPISAGGIYILRDVDEEPLYVGQSTGMRNRIQRHLTNMRTDAVGKNLLDPWEVVYVDYWIRADDAAFSLNDMEAAVSALHPETLNEKAPPTAVNAVAVPDDLPRIKLLPDDEVTYRRRTNTRIAYLVQNATKLADRIYRYKDEQRYRLVLKLQIKRIYALMAHSEYEQPTVGQVYPEPLAVPTVDVTQAPSVDSDEAEAEADEV
jgi:hypothetical protein